MGLFDLPAPVFGAVDGVLAFALPDVIRLILWGILAGWLTMLLYRRLSNQEKISALKAEQKTQQKLISEFDGEFDELLPLIRHTLTLGFKQLGLAIGPALLASLPVLFLVAWVAGQFGYTAPEAGTTIEITTVPDNAVLEFQPPAPARARDGGWTLAWPTETTPVTLRSGEPAVLQFPLSHAVPVIHKKQWWNLFFANPLGYLPDDDAVEVINIHLAPQEFIPAGPSWLRGWMFTFFMVFLVSSVGFKFALKID